MKNKRNVWILTLCIYVIAIIVLIRAGSIPGICVLTLAILIHIGLLIKAKIEKHAIHTCPDCNSDFKGRICDKCGFVFLDLEEETELKKVMEQPTSADQSEQIDIDFEKVEQIEISAVETVTFDSDIETYLQQK